MAWLKYRGGEIFSEGVKPGVNLNAARRRHIIVMALSIMKELKSAEEEKSSISAKAASVTVIGRWNIWWLCICLYTMPSHRVYQRRRILSVKRNAGSTVENGCENLW